MPCCGNRTSQSLSVTEIHKLTGYFSLESSVAHPYTRFVKSLPSGTATFLFTDIQGSTKLWEQVPEKMQRALQRHHEILNCAIESHAGVVFQIVGDAFCAAFHTAPAALSAAVKV